MRGTRKRLRKGMTLIEVLVASAVMALFVAMVGQTLVTGYRSQASASRQLSYFREGMAGISFLAYELRFCKTVVQPTPLSWSEGQSYSPEKGVRPPFVFLRYSAQAGRDILVAYEFNPKTKELQRFLYVYYTPSCGGCPVVEGSTKTVATSVEKLQITKLPSLTPAAFFKIDLVLSRDEVFVPLSLDVRVAGL